MFVMIYLKFHNAKQNKVKVKAVWYGQYSETSDWIFLEIL